MTGHCVLPKEAGATSGSSSSGSGAKVNISSLGAMLNARWKEGTGENVEKEQVRVGQILKFKITAMDVAQKRIDVELVG